MRARRIMPVATAVLVAVGAAGPATGAPSGIEPRLDAVVERILDLPYQPAFVPTGTDTAFGDTAWPAAFPVTDTTSGTCCAGPAPDQPPLADLAPPFAAFPDSFESVELTSYDGTPLHARVSIVPGAPGVVVMHGFNTNGKHSIVRYAAALRANGFSVIAPDHRDMGREWERGGSWHPDGTRHGQSLGWKESEDLLVAAADLRSRGVDRVGVLGFSEGAQNTILALGKDHDGLIDAALTFSGPADQATLARRNEASTAALMTTVVNNPDVCGYLAEVGARDEFAASPNFMLRHDSAVDTLDGIVGAGVDTPALHVYADDDQLVPSWNAVALASRTTAMPSQRTLLAREGNHAYFYDRWWTQAAALEWFRTWLDPHDTTTATPTVAQTAGGTPFRDHLVDLSGTTRADGDAELRDRALCPAATAPVGPTALLEVTSSGGTHEADGRRSWSGWDDHELVGWTIDFGDGSAPARGVEVAAARASHTYAAPGRYEIRLTVEDDTGRTAETVELVTVDGDGPSPAAETTPSGDDAAPATAAPGAPGTPQGRAAVHRGQLPATGAGTAPIAAVVLLTAALTSRRRRSGRSSARATRRPAPR